MLKCKIEDKILDYDFMLDSQKIDEEQLNRTVKVLEDNGFFYLGCGGVLMDNETPRDNNRFHFFKRQFSERGSGIAIFSPEDIYNYARGCVQTRLEPAIFPNFSSMPFRNLDSISDSLYRLEDLSNHKWSHQELLRLEDDFYVNIPQRTPPGRTPKQHKLIMSFNKKSKRN